jgi:hypothetical protein
MEKMLKIVLVTMIASLSFGDINAMGKIAKILVSAPVIRRIPIISRTLPARLSRIHSLEMHQDGGSLRTLEPLTHHKNLADEKITQIAQRREEKAFLEKVESYYMRREFPLVEAFNDYVADFGRTEKILTFLKTVQEENLKASDSETKKIAAEVSEEIAQLSEQQEATEYAIHLIKAQKGYLKQWKAKAAQDAAKATRDNADATESLATATWINAFSNKN